MPHSRVGTASLTANKLSAAELFNAGARSCSLRYSTAEFPREVRAVGAAEAATTRTSPDLSQAGIMPAAPVHGLAEKNPQSRIMERL